MLQVSVIMSIYREPVEIISPAIHSILNQTFTDWELILVLDDPTNDEARRYIHSLQTTEPRIRLLENERNLGLGASLNKAIAIAQGHYCARMDTEDISFADRLAKQIAYFREYPETDLLFTQWQEENEVGVIKKRQPNALDVQNIQKNFFIKSLLLHPTMMAKTSVLTAHPYPAMSRPEDWVLFLELIRLNYRFALLEEVLYEYKVDTREKYKKVRAYTTNLLPHLYRNIRWYWKNPYFWFYYMRILAEYIISRHQYIYKQTNTFAASVWRTIFSK